MMQKIELATTKKSLPSLILIINLVMLLRPIISRGLYFGVLFHHLGFESCVLCPIFPLPDTDLASELSSSTCSDCIPPDPLHPLS